MMGAVGAGAAGRGYTTIDNHQIPQSVPAATGTYEAPVSFSGLCSVAIPISRRFHLLVPKGEPLDHTVLLHKLMMRSPGPSLGNLADETEQSGWVRRFTVGTYKPYFDVDTSDVVERIRDSLLPFSGGFSEKTSDNPDLYGPFWICTTLIFVAAAIGTFTTYLAHTFNKKEWDYDINLITWSAGLFYGYVTIVPLILYVILKYFSAPSGLVQLFCLYGYSLFVFIPASCLSIIPVEIFRWVVAGAAGFMSAAFVALNLRTHIMSSGESWFLLVGGIFLLQLSLSIVLKLYFFTVKQ